MVGQATVITRSVPGEHSPAEASDHGRGSRWELASSAGPG